MPAPGGAGDSRAGRRTARIRSAAHYAGLFEDAEVAVAVIARVEELFRIERAEIVEVLVQRILQCGGGLGGIVVRAAGRLDDDLVDDAEFFQAVGGDLERFGGCLLYTSPSPRD